MRKYLPDCNCGAVPAPNNTGSTYKCRPTKITLRTTVLPASAGTDEAGQPYAPHPGAYYNTVVGYAANGNVYIYDSNGVYTLVYSGLDATALEEVTKSLATLEGQVDGLYHPPVPATTVETVADLANLDPTAYPVNSVVLVKEDNNLYYYNTSSGEWEIKDPATPYYTKTEIDAMIGDINSILDNINGELPTEGDTNA